MALDPNRWTLKTQEAFSAASELGDTASMTTPRAVAGRRY